MLKDSERQSSNDFASKPSFASKEKLESIQRLKQLSFYCFFFMLVELTGGYFSNSVSIIALGLHTAANLQGHLVQLISENLSLRKRDSVFTFGFFRTEGMGVLITCFFLWTLTFILTWESLKRLIYGSSFLNERIMLITALIAILIKLFMAIVLLGLNNLNAVFRFEKTKERSSAAKQRQLPTKEAISPSVHISTPHSFDTIQDITMSMHKEDERLIEFGRKVNLHSIQNEFIYTIVVLVTAVLLNLFKHLRLLDSLCAIIFVYVVVQLTSPIFKEALDFLLEKSPSGGLISGQLQPAGARLQIHQGCGKYSRVSRVGAFHR